MEAAYNVELGDRFRPAFPCPVPDFFERPGVGFGIFGFLSERAELATGHADIGGVDVR